MKNTLPYAAGILTLLVLVVALKPTHAFETIISVIIFLGFCSVLDTLKEISNKLKK